MSDLAITLKPGSNAFVAVMAAGGAPEDKLERIGRVATVLAASLGSTLEFAGSEPTGMTNGLVYVIGNARPVYISQIGPSDQLSRWYESYDSPLGPDVTYYSVNVDWRAAPQTIMSPSGIIVFPGGDKPVNGAATWPDGTLEEQKMRLQEERADKRAAAVASAAQAWAETSTFVAKTMGGTAAEAIAPVAKVLAPLAIGGIALYLLIVFSSKRKTG